MLQFSRTEHPIRQAVLTSPIEDAGGVVSVPDGPGPGIEVNRDAIASFAPR
jgi:D-galactarolactone cycloisomerase